MSPSKSTRPTTRAKNKDTHPGDAIPKKQRRSKAQMQAAQEAEQVAKKKKEVEKGNKLTRIAQVADDIVLETQAQEMSEPRSRPSTRPRRLKRAYAMLDVTSESEMLETQEASEPRSRPRGLKRTYAMLDVTSDKENQSAVESDAGEQSDDYAPSGPGSESMDPGSESDTQRRDNVDPPKKKRGKKASILQEIRERRQHLDPILEEEPEVVVVEQERGDLMASDINELPHGTHAEVGSESQGRLPFKAGIKKSWAQRNTESAQAPPTVPPPKASKKGMKREDSRVAADPISIKPAPVTANKQATKESSPDLYDSETIPAPKVINTSKAKSSAKHPVNVPKTSQTLTQAPIQPRPHPRPLHKVSLVSQAQAPETPFASTAHRHVATLQNQATPVNVGGGIPEPEDESDTEEYTAAKSSPIKAGQRITSNAIVSIRPAGQAAASAAGMRKPSLAPEVDAAKAVEPELELINDRASVAPSEDTGRFRRPRGAGRSQSATYEDLPSDVSREIFREVYIPTVAKYLSRLADPWSTNTPEFLNVVQLIWNEVFPSISYTFSASKARCDVIRLITQRLCEWRAKFATAAIDAVLDLEASDADLQNPRYRKEWVMWATQEDTWPFLHADNESDDPEEWSGTFASPLITQAFAAHLAFTANTVVIKKLQKLEAKPPSGALALATTAVERALAVWDNGELQDWRQLRDKSRPSLAKFDATTWSKATGAWLRSIYTLTTESWDDIIDIARQHIKPTSRKQPSLRESKAMENRAILIARPRRK